ncbi:hydroxyacid dehydrogenase [Candidatus Woesearchaeota archaeon]|nr:hydroxyacid dehydrogenase [Candidatus Woesearchaeota archaeon]
MKTVFFEIKAWEKKYLKDNLMSKKLSFSRSKLTKNNLKKAKDAEIISIFIYSKIDKKILEDLPKLKFIVTRSTGFDHIDIKECKKRGIKVSNIPSYGENTVAEHTFALILNISRKLCESFKRTRDENFSPEGLTGFDLKNKTLGIIGCGNIGQHVARIAKGFEMKVIVSDPNQNFKLAKEIGFKYVTLDNLLKNSDIISLHAPHNPHTHHMIDNKNILKIKKGAIMINTARGGLIDTKALIKALNNKTLRAAGLDVLEGECFVKEEKELLHSEFKKTCDLKTILTDHILLKKPNVYITPHNAFNSKEALLRILDTTIENIKAFNKKKPINLVK